MRRTLSNMEQGEQMGNFISNANRAYKKNMGCLDILNSHSFIMEMASRTSTPALCLMMDLAKFYDTVQLDMVEVQLRLKGAPEGVVNLFQAMYEHSTIIISTQYGDTQPIRPEIHRHSPR
jgi:hypothetical protein